jgi:hypothetical protein
MTQGGLRVPDYLAHIREAIERNLLSNTAKFLGL